MASLCELPQCTARSELRGCLADLCKNVPRSKWLRNGVAEKSLLFLIASKIQVFRNKDHKGHKVCVQLFEAFGLRPSYVQNVEAGVATVYGLDYRGSILSRGKRFFSAPFSPDRLWGPPSLLSNGYRGFLQQG
jgi:hypothetical protein